jgi:hypothetical protein
MSPIGRLWASKVKADERILERGDLVERIHKLGYLDAGRTWYEL